MISQSLSLPLYPLDSGVTGQDVYDLSDVINQCFLTMLLDQTMLLVPSHHRALVHAVLDTHPAFLPPSIHSPNLELAYTSAVWGLWILGTVLQWELSFPLFIFPQESGLGHLSTECSWARWWWGQQEQPVVGEGTACTKALWWDGTRSIVWSRSMVKQCFLFHPTTGP